MFDDLIPKDSAQPVVDRHVQDRIVALFDRHNTFLNIGESASIAVLLLMLGAVPYVLSWAWYALLRRIAELSAAIRGSRPQ
jgi:hypothetical protein